MHLTLQGASSRAIRATLELVVVDWMGGLRWVYRFVTTIASDCTAADVVGDLCVPSFVSLCCARALV
jgi:hypothetical protein